MINAKELFIRKQTRIVKAVKRYLPEIAQIQKKIYNEKLDEGWTQETAEQFINYSYKKQPDLFFAAKNHNKIAGYSFGYIKPWSDGNHLMCEELVVDTPFQEKGIAKLLHRTLVEEAIKKYSITAVEAATYHGENGMPLAWYERLGWTKQNLILIFGNPHEILENLKKSGR